jgi:branched-chain amino acid transport system substrate-binding protein
MGGRVKRFRRCAGALVVLALIATACGDDDDDSGSSAATTAASGGATTAASGSSSGAVRGVTDTEITVGGISEVTLYPGIEEGAKARFERANRDGGVHGRTIKFVGVRDDGSDSARDLDLARELVGKDKVFAVAPATSAVLLPATTDYLASENVPFFGWGFQPGFCGPDQGYGFNGCLIGPDFANSSFLDGPIQAAGLKPADAKIAVQSANASFGESANAQAERAAKENGAQIVYAETNYPPDQTVPDATPYVQAIMAAKPNIVIVNLAFASTISVIAGLKSAGYDGDIFNFIAYLPGMLDDQPDLAAALDGTYTVTQIVPVEGRAPVMLQIEEDLKAIGQEPFAGLGHQVGWFSADLLLAMLDATGPDLTPESFNEAINTKGFSYEFGDGGLGPLTFPEYHKTMAPCTAVVKTTGTTYEQIVPMTCYTALPFN